MILLLTLTLWAIILGLVWSPWLAVAGGVGFTVCVLVALERREGT